MSDNVAVTAGSGTPVAADDIASVWYQRVKVDWGADGTATDADHAIGKGMPVQAAPISHFHLITAATTNPTNIKGSAGKLRSVHVFNNAATPIYVKFHDVAGTPTAGTGVVLTVGCQAGLPRDFIIPGARSFTNGIGMTVVLNQVDSDANAVALNDASIEVTYE